MQSSASMKGRCAARAHRLQPRGARKGGAGAGSDGGWGCAGPNDELVDINGSFEEWSVTLPSGWNSDAKIEKAPDALFGSNAVRMHLPNGAYVSLLAVPNFSVAIGDTLWLRCSIRVAAGVCPTPQPGLRIANPNGTGDAYFLDNFAQDKKWNTLEQAFVVDTKDELYVQFGGQGGTNDPPVTLVDVDGISVCITHKPESTELAPLS